MSVLDIMDSVMDVVTYALNNKDRIHIDDYDISREGTIVTMVIIAKDEESAEIIKSIIDKLVEKLKGVAK